MDKQDAFATGEQAIMDVMDQRDRLGKLAAAMLRLRNFALVDFTGKAEAVAATEREIRRLEADCIEHGDLPTDDEWVRFRDEPVEEEA